MQLENRIERTHELKNMLSGPGPAVVQHWEDYRKFEAMMGGDHEVALFFAEQDVKREISNGKFNTPVAQSDLDLFVIRAPTILRWLDKDISAVIEVGGNDAIVYLKTLSDLRQILTRTLEHYQRIVGV
jgi:hypothetical protein